MIQEAIQFLLERGEKASRPAILVANDGSKRSWLYNDGDAKYEEIDLEPLRHVTVSNMASFIALTKDSVRRRAVGLKIDASPASSEDQLRFTGADMTVVFTPYGADLRSRDLMEISEEQLRYQRRLSYEWETLLTILNQPPGHAGFVRSLQRLRPAIANYPAVITAFRRVTLDSSAQVMSQPTLVDGAMASQYKLDIQAKGGTTETSLPSTILLKLPYASGDERTWDVEAELDIALVEERDGRKLVKFTLLAPDLPAVESAAIEAEIAEFQGAFTNLEHLLVVRNV